MINNRSMSLGKNFPYEELLDWFMSVKRDLPWRKNPSFYEVLISEVMLQQTQVQTVIPYFNHWMMRFPSLLSLAESSLDEVIKAWEGLGYYSRARNLHKLARVICFETKSLPKTYESLIKLPGIGDYTASAILAFAFKRPEIAVDGNVLRVGVRFFGVNESIKQDKTKKLIKSLFEEVKREDSSFAESLIELGACICKKKPDCHACPLKKCCYAFNEGKTEELPFSEKSKKIIKLKTEIALVIHDEKILVKHVKDGVMKGLYQFPKLEEMKSTDYKLCLESNFYEIKQRYTQFEEILIPKKLIMDHYCEFEEFEWVLISLLENLPFSSGHRKIKDLIKQST